MRSKRCAVQNQGITLTVQIFSVISIGYEGFNVCVNRSLDLMQTKASSWIFLESIYDSFFPQISLNCTFSKLLETGRQESIYS